MKNLFLILFVMASGVMVMSFSNIDSKPISSPESNAYEVPDDVQNIIDNSCYGCHNSDSKSTKGKMKLNFDKMPEFNDGKLIGKLKKIHDVVAEDDMPPKKFLANYPEKALTDVEKETLSKWAIELANKIGGE